MAVKLQLAALRAFGEFLKPMVRMLLRYGIGYREFSEACKIAFVEVASTDYGIRGRRTNMSRVAVITGLTRKEVRKIRDRMDNNAIEQIVRDRRPSAVLSLWHFDPEFVDEKRQPLRLKFDGAGPSFRSLVSKAGGDITPRAMLNELLRAGSVVEDGEFLRVVSQSYVPEPDDPESVLIAGDAIHDLVSTINHNLGCGDPETRYFERRVFSVQLPLGQRARFRRLARDRGNLLLKDLNAWLLERELTMPRSAEELELDRIKEGRIGVGIYFFDSASPASTGRELDREV